MSDRRPSSFSLVSALADRLFSDGPTSLGRRRERSVRFTPRPAAGAAATDPPQAPAPRRWQ